VADKFTAFGWTTYEVNGNDLAALTDALVACRAADGTPKAIVMRTTPGFGVPSLVNKPRAHFVRVGDDEWSEFMDELVANRDQ
jgi:transketolase